MHIIFPQQSKNRNHSSISTLPFFRLPSTIPLNLRPSSLPTSLPPPPTALRLGGARAIFFLVFLDGFGRLSMYDGTGHPEAVRTFAILYCQLERASER